MIREIIIAICVGVVLANFSPAMAQTTGSPELGKTTYQTFCIVCHGPTGEGSPLGQALNTIDVKLKSDSEILNIITNGVPGTAMSSYGSGLSKDEIFWTMIYIRELQGDFRVRGTRAEDFNLPQPPATTEQAQAGEALFNGEAGCIQCHSYRTRGGFLGPDLSNVAVTMPPEDIRAAVLQPSAHINPNFQSKQLQLTDGTRVEGRFRNETINHIQIANEDATLWRTYFKKDISRMRDGRTSLMPDDYATRLTEEQQEQLFAFLDTLK